jgi:hypothetical protein
MTRYAKKLLLGRTLGICLLSTAWMSHADTYRWVDDQGIVNYAAIAPRDLPPEQIRQINLQRTPGLGDQNGAETQTTVTDRNLLETSAAPEALNPGQAEIMRDLQKVEAARLAQMAKIRTDNCLRARRVLANLTASPRIRVRAADGSEQALAETDRQDRIVQAQAAITNYCPDPA